MSMSNLAKRVPARSNTPSRRLRDETCTAALILALRDAGPLELDAAAEAYLPEIQVVARKAPELRDDEQLSRATPPRRTPGAPKMNHVMIARSV